MEARVSYLDVCRRKVSRERSLETLLDLDERSVSFVRVEALWMMLIEFEFNRHSCRQAQIAMPRTFDQGHAAVHAQCTDHPIPTFAVDAAWLLIEERPRHELYTETRLIDQIWEARDGMLKQTF